MPKHPFRKHFFSTTGNRNGIFSVTVSSRFYISLIYNSCQNENWRQDALRNEAHRSRDIKCKPMTDYRRVYIPGATWFFTVNLAERRRED